MIDFRTATRALALYEVFDTIRRAASNTNDPESIAAAKSVLNQYCSYTQINDTPFWEFRHDASEFSCTRLSKWQGNFDCINNASIPVRYRMGFTSAIRLHSFLTIKQKATAPDIQNMQWVTDISRISGEALCLPERGRASGYSTIRKLLLFHNLCDMLFQRQALATASGNELNSAMRKAVLAAAKNILPEAASLIETLDQEDTRDLPQNVVDLIHAILDRNEYVDAYARRIFSWIPAHRLFYFQNRVHAIHPIYEGSPRVYPLYEAEAAYLGAIAHVGRRQSAPSASLPLVLFSAIVGSRTTPVDKTAITDLFLEAAHIDIVRPHISDNGSDLPRVWESALLECLYLMKHVMSQNSHYFSRSYGDLPVVHNQTQFSIECPLGAILNVVQFWLRTTHSEVDSLTAAERYAMLLRRFFEVATPEVETDNAVNLLANLEFSELHVAHLTPYEIRVSASDAVPQFVETPRVSHSLYVPNGLRISDPQDRPFRPTTANGYDASRYLYQWLTAKGVRVRNISQVWQIIYDIPGAVAAARSAGYDRFACAMHHRLFCRICACPCCGAAGPCNCNARRLKRYSSGPPVPGPRFGSRRIGMELELIAESTEAFHELLARYPWCHSDTSLSDNGAECKMIGYADQPETISRTIQLVCGSDSLPHPVKADSSCGLHIHVERSPRDNLNTLVSRWYRTERDIWHLFPTRSDNEYCRSVRTGDVYDHHAVLSISSRHPTVEYRVHPGTSSWLVAVCWAAWCATFSEREFHDTRIGALGRAYWNARQLTADAMERRIVRSESRDPHPFAWRYLAAKMLRGKSTRKILEGIANGALREFEEPIPPGSETERKFAEYHELGSAMMRV